MKEITAAIKARQRQVKQLQRELGALQKAATVLSGKRAATVARPTATRQPTPDQQVKGKRRGLSAAAKKAVSERMKKYWAKRKK